MSSHADLFSRIYALGEATPEGYQIHSCPQLIERIQTIGFLPLLDSGIAGYSAEAMMADECRYVQFPDGSWEWPLWEWKGLAATEGNCVYGKFFDGKAGFVSRQWWPDFFNWRRSQNPVPQEGSIEELILSTLRQGGSMIARKLRAACDFTGPKMRSRFDSYVARLQMGCHIVTADFVYPRDKHGREYGFGWALLTTPEYLLGHEACQCERTPMESYERMQQHLARLLPFASQQQIDKMLK